MSDLKLLRQYEPIIRFTQGELFFPCGIDHYVKRCSLWQRDADGNETMVADVGHVSAETLAQFEDESASHSYYLRFVQEPLSILNYQQWRSTRPQFSAIGRLLRVNFFSRLIDALFDLSLVVRGTVPGGTAAAASVQYREMRSKGMPDLYYGRVVREGGYIILHYLFFYVMNDWRSGFYGVNDHEADWEQVFVYLSDEGSKPPQPRWVAYASHDFKGDDLRRHWLDPEVEKVGEHPVIYAGAGSHGSYFQKGEYLMQVAPAFLDPLVRVFQALGNFWRDVLQQGEATAIRAAQAAVRVPFVDYARGDGESIGPYQRRHWSVKILDESQSWLHDYRGLWGLDTEDFVGGERAPGGAKFNRDGTVRQSWSDPLGWAGLDKVSPPAERLLHLQHKLTYLEDELAEIGRKITAQRDVLRDLALEADALARLDNKSVLYTETVAQLQIAQDALRDSHQQETNLQESQRALLHYRTQLETGSEGNIRAHIHHAHPPEPSLEGYSRLLELWATFSSALLIIALIFLLIVPQLRNQIWLGIGIVIASFVVIESILQRRLLRLLLNLTIALAAFSALILLYTYLRYVVTAALVSFVLLILRENFREWRRW